MTKRTGRPPLSPHDPSVLVTTRVTGKTYDDLYARARAARVSLSEFIRTRLSEIPRSTHSSTKLGR